VREGDKLGLACRANAVLNDRVKRVEKGELKPIRGTSPSWGSIEAQHADLGWVERSETHHAASMYRVMGFAAAQPILVLARIIRMRLFREERPGPGGHLGRAADRRIVAHHSLDG
jgi:hypothetical protein